MLPTYCFPAQDVRIDLMHPSAEADPSAEAASGWIAEHDVRIGDDLLERAAQRFSDPPAPLSALDGH